MEREAIQEASAAGLLDEETTKTLLDEITERLLRLEATGVLGAPPLPAGSEAEVEPPAEEE